MSDRAASPIQTDKPTAENGAPDSTNMNPKKRPRLDLEVEPRKKGKRSVFGQVFGTLKRAKDEDKLRNASDAAKKRQEIDSRILSKITQDQKEVRRVEEAKKDRSTATRKEEDLAIKDGIVRLRQNVIPRLAGFLLTTDVIPRTSASSRSPSPFRDDQPTSTVLNHPPKTKQPPALYYLPAKLTLSQEKFLEKQKESTHKVLEEEKKEWIADRTKGVEEITELRKKAEEYFEQRKRDKDSAAPGGEEDVEMKDDTSPTQEAPESEKVDRSTPAAVEPIPESEGAVASNSVAMDTEDAIEY
ncbi:hypothetical protein FRC02_009048 [Tulasnella sp. 418]|nr:hypothetical protein FRC02_009048 [Tulasnella sp. 418]